MMKIKRIVLIGGVLNNNFGGPAIVVGLANVLKRICLGIKLIFLSPDVRDLKLSKVYNITVVHYSLRNPIGFMALMKNIVMADMIVDIRGIAFTDAFGDNFLLRLLEGIHILLGRLLKKKLIKYSADMGPFRKRWNRVFARFYLNMLDLIIARSVETRKHLLALGVKKAIRVCPDVSFLLKPANVPRPVSGPIVGVCVSSMAFKQAGGKRYITAMVKLVRHVVEELNAHVLLIPNETFPERFNDVNVAFEILSRIPENIKHKVLILTRPKTAHELKAAISWCDLVISARYHTIIAALSLGIPTIAISWHHKYREFMRLLGQELFVCDINKLDAQHLCKMTDTLWVKRNEISEEINKRMKKLKKRVLSITKDVFSRLLT